jgi:hypothetical protein
MNCNEYGLIKLIIDSSPVSPRCRDRRQGSELAAYGGCSRKPAEPPEHEEMGAKPILEVQSLKSRAFPSLSFRLRHLFSLPLLFVVFLSSLAALSKPS